MYRTDFWTLWEKARVGCFERTACILSIVKQITSPGGMHETSSRAWCTGKTQRNRVEKEVGGGIAMGIHVTPWLIHVTVWQNPLQCCEVISLQLIKINGKKKKECFLYSLFCSDFLTAKSSEAISFLISLYLPMMVDPVPTPVYSKRSPALDCLVLNIIVWPQHFN